MMMNMPAPVHIPVNGDALRKVMRHVASPVTVVTVRDEDIRGITIGSFTSVSLDPPLISFNVQEEASLHAFFLSNGNHFAVNILSQAQAGLSDHFAVPDRSGEAQFQSIAYESESHGIPVLGGNVATLICSVYASHAAGDHALVLGLVEAVYAGSETAPLLYYDRSYRTVSSQ